jgi:VanZ family protein
MMVFRLENLPRWLRDVTPLVMWMALIFLFSAQSTLIKIEHEINEKIFYKTAHMLGYAVLAWLWWRTLTPQRRITWSVLLTAVALTALYAISDEIHQLFVPGRTGRLADVFFDTGGALAMILLIRRIKWLRTFPDSLSFPITGKLGGES